MSVTTQSNLTQKFSAHTLFGLYDKEDDHAILGRSERSNKVPKINSKYEFPEGPIYDIVGWWLASRVTKDSLWVFGPTGCGKTTILTQMLARLNVPVEIFSGHKSVEWTDLIGSVSLLDGDTFWQDGPLTTAMREGHVFLFDEIDLCPPTAIAGLNAITEGRGITLPDGEYIEPHPDFRLVATGNTAGAGDESGVYGGTFVQNFASLDRFLIVEMTYMDPETELRALKGEVNFFGDDILKRMVQVANDIRDQFLNMESETGIEVTMSTRSLIRWAYYSRVFKYQSSRGVNPFEYAMDRVLGMRSGETTRAFLSELTQRHLTAEAFQGAA